MLVRLKDLPWSNKSHSADVGEHCHWLKIVLMQYYKMLRRIRNMCFPIEKFLFSYLNNDECGKVFKQQIPCNFLFENFNNLKAPTLI